MRLPCLVAALAMLLPGAPGLADPAESIARGDAAWQRRAEGADGPRADPGPVQEAVAAYAAALEEDPSRHEARWKLMRALYFQGEHTGLDDDARLAVFERGRELGEEGLDRLAEGLGGREALDDLSPAEVAAALGSEPAAAPLYFWTAVHWGLWGQTRGKMAAARQGVASRIRDGALATIALDPVYEQAGGHRVLGRLHDEAPKIPFVTGWVDRDTAVRELERAVELAPDDTLNRLYLAEALLRRERARRDEALELLRGLAQEEPRDHCRVEDAKALADARALLRRAG
ncbi:MAG: hypothetical protein R3325_01960 [Thermoanaerobaculia bacterium]|nr:hypothetical protein [Thermoanaerobaculia bacterium]